MTTDKLDEIIEKIVTRFDNGLQGSAFDAIKSIHDPLETAYAVGTLIASKKISYEDTLWLLNKIYKGIK